MEVMRQITYLLFIRRLDDAQTLEEGKALAFKRPVENRVFPDGKDAKRLHPCLVLDTSASSRSQCRPSCFSSSRMLATVANRQQTLASLYPNGYISTP